VQLKREARLKGGFYVSPEAKLLFVVRIRGWDKLLWSYYMEESVCSCLFLILLMLKLQYQCHAP
jgi:hypothetical protein